MITKIFIKLYRIQYRDIKVIKNKIFLILGLILGISCKDNPYVSCGQRHTMDENYKISFNLNDSIIFKSNLNNYKYYYIKFLNAGYITRSQDGMNSSDCVAYYEYELISICPLYDSTCINISPTTIYDYNCKECLNCLNICKVMDTNPISAKHKKIGNLELKWKNLWSKKLSERNSSYASLKINNSEYYNVSLFNTEIIDSTQTINKVYYNHKYGFIGFETTNNEIWNIQIE